MTNSQDSDRRKIKGIYPTPTFHKAIKDCRHSNDENKNDGDKGKMFSSGFTKFKHALILTKNAIALTYS